MEAFLRIRTVVFANGERMPLMLDKGGIPLFAPTVFIATQARARNRAANTIEQMLRSVKVLYLHCGAVGIDIEERVRTGQMLTIAEIDGLARAVRLPIDEIVEGERERLTSRSLQVVSLEKARAHIRVGHQKSIDHKTAAIRLRYIQQYLAWLSLDQLSRRSERSGKADFDGARSLMLEAIGARIATGGRKTEREGLSEKAIKELLRVIDVDCPDSPWSQPAARFRNRLIILLLYTLGIRASELLAIRVEDLDLRTNRLAIIRRPDDPIDLRRVQPTVKTLGRVLPLDPALAKFLYEYVVNIRSQAKGAAFHPFLLVETDAGCPLSKSALSKIFTTLADASDLLAGISPHVLRHTWNDLFSKRADGARMLPAEEEKMRSYLMGWREGAGTARTYTKRHVRESANKASLELQRSLIGNDQDH